MDLRDVVRYAERVTRRSFASRDVATLERDGFRLVTLAPDLMAYVAMSESSQSALARQRTILARIAPRLSFPVPRPVGPLVLEGRIDLRVPVKGESGEALHARIMADADHRRRVASWMGRALAELHASLAELELEALSVPHLSPGTARLQLGVETHLEGAARAEGLETVRRWERRLGELSPRALLHGDFGSHNLSFDAASGMPVGVFDFHDMTRGPAFVDLKLLPSYGRDATAAALDAYHEAAAPPIHPADVALAHAACALDYLAWRAEDPDAHDRKSGRDRARAIAWAMRATADVINGSCS